MAGRRDPSHAHASSIDVRGRKQISFNNVSHEMEQHVPNFANKLLTDQ